MDFTSKVRKTSSRKLWLRFIEIWPLGFGKIRPKFSEQGEHMQVGAKRVCNSDSASNFTIVWQQRWWKFWKHAPTLRFFVNFGQIAQNPCFDLNWGPFNLKACVVVFTRPKIEWQIWILHQKLEKIQVESYGYDFTKFGH